MKTKVFISYAHKDEEYKQSLVEHMSSLKRSNIVSEWNDREIVAGQNWSEEISAHLESSNLILFLISSSFMNSDYCMGIEVETALRMHQEGKTQLIPIIIRPVDWDDSELSKLQGLPKDALAISSWLNEDEAWVNVIGGIKKNIQSFQPQKQPIIQTVSTDIIPTQYTTSWLGDTEIVLTHRKVNKISLCDIYVVPDIELENKNLS